MSVAAEATIERTPNSGLLKRNALMSGPPHSVVTNATTIMLVKRIAAKLSARANASLAQSYRTVRGKIITLI
jgi:hypothetical protein